MTEIGRFNGATGDSKQLHEIPWKEYLEKKNYNKDINQMCPLCIKDQIKKYGQVTIKCEGLLSGEKKIPPELRHHFSEEEVELVEQAINPYKWAEKNIDTKNDNPSTKLFSHRWYQEFILRCSSRRKAIRAGRRVGKCISEDAMIPLKSGRVITARQLLSEYSNGIVNEILTFDTQTSKITTTKIFDVFENGEKDVFTLTTKTGKKIDITDNHPFLTIGDDGNYNWVEAKDLKIGNMIGCPSKISIFGDNDIGDDLSRFIGYITGDGSITNGVSFTNGDFEVFSDFINTTKKVWNNSSVTYKNYPNKKTGNDRFTGNVVFRESKGNDAISFLKEIGMFGKNAYTKTTPEIIMTSTKSNVKNYLMGLFETDGWAALGRSLPDNRKTRLVQVGYTSASEMLARSVRHLLLRFGIVATIREKRVNYKNELRKYFCVEFSSKKNIEIFANEIGFISNRKRNCLNMIMDELSRKKYCGNESINLMPKEILSPVYKYIEEEKLSARKIVDDPINERIRKIYNVSKDKVKRYAEKIQNAKLTEIASSDVMWDEIKSIEYAGVKKTIDLSVPETNSFVTEDIITHNTQSIAMGIVHKMLTNEKYYVLVVTPFDAQAEEVYVKVKQILNNLKESYDELVYSAKESPNYQVTLKNGSRVRCFTAGSSGAAQVRGQPANLIYIDECDYLGQKDFNSILAILLDKPDTELWVTSTPNGEKQLYRLSQDKAYKEFHFPSYVLPHYSDDLDNDLRSQSDDTGYVQEVMAEFSTSRDGVFQPYYVDMCSKIKTIAPSAEEVLANRSNFIVTMGCDWNHQNIGTRIIALVYDRKNNLFSILDKATVAKEGWTQTAAMEKIIEFNRQYRFDKIYVDRGFGYTQIETLKSFAIAQFGKLPKGHPDLLLAEVVGIDFGSKIEVQDPYTNQTVKKDIKPFMVSVLNKVIEKIAIKLDGKKDAAIMAQLKGYEEKRSASGRPTYSASSATVGDHDLDALMLAMFAFNVEYDEIFSSMKSQLAINILTSQDMHGKDVSHLNPNHNKTTLEIKTKRRDNYSPGSRTVMFKQSIQFEERGSPGEIRSDMFYNGNWTGQTKLNRTAHRRASFKW